VNITYIRAPKDVDGYPRRGWTVWTPRGLTFIEGDCDGHSPLYEWLGCGNSSEGVYIFDMYVNEMWRDCTVSEYEYAKYESAYQLVNS
jgi:hypothetical protein